MAVIRRIRSRMFLSQKWTGLQEEVDLPVPAAVPPLRIRYFRLRQPQRARLPRQNKLAVREERQVDLLVLRYFFCGAASARASICACKAFNTDARAGSIRQTAEEPAMTAA